MTIEEPEWFAGVAPRTEPFAPPGGKLQIVVYPPRTDIRAWVDRFTSALGVQPGQFTVGSVPDESSIPNAQASLHPATKKPQILYNSVWLRKVIATEGDSGQQAWSARYILLHELGHILQGHVPQLMARSNLDDRARKIRRHELELDADYFAGFHIARSGCALDESRAALMHVVQTPAETNTHPARPRRIAALSAGWNAAQNLPTSSPVASVVSGPAPLPVKFANQQQGAGNNVDTYLWDFGDGTTSQDSAPSHIYESAGSYTVKLTVRSANGSDNNFLNSSIQVYEPTKADFAATPLNGGAPLRVVFSSRSSGAPSTFVWDFGDGKTGSGESVEHVYEKEGKYTVRLTVDGPGGADIDERTDYVVVSGGEPPRRPRRNPKENQENRSLAAPLLIASHVGDRVNMRVNSRGVVQNVLAGTVGLRLTFAHRLSGGGGSFIPLLNRSRVPLEWRSFFYQHSGGDIELGTVGQFGTTFPYSMLNFAPSGYQRSYDVQITGEVWQGGRVITTIPSTEIVVRW